MAVRKSSRGNPYHDERGRFCSGPKGKGSYTVSERTAEEYAKRTKERFAEQKKVSDAVEDARADGCTWVMVVDPAGNYGINQELTESDFGIWARDNEITEYETIDGCLICRQKKMFSEEDIENANGAGYTPRGYGERLEGKDKHTLREKYEEMKDYSKELGYKATPQHSIDKGTQLVTGIMWDVDEDADGNPLPTTVEVPAGMDEDEISDYLGDKYDIGFEGFSLETDNSR